MNYLYDIINLTFYELTGETNDQTKNCRTRSWFLGTALSQVLNDNGHEVRIWGNIPEQLDEINEHHTNKRYFKDMVLDEKIQSLSRFRGCS